MKFTPASVFNGGRWVIRIAGLLIILAYVGQFFDRPGALQEGSSAPDIDMPLSDGSQLDLGAMEAPLVLSFWASFCEPCKREAPILNALHDGGTRVVGVNTEDFSPPQASAAAQAMGMRFPIVAPGDEVSRRFEVQAVPTTYVIAADGTIVRRHRGVVTTEALREALDEARDKSG